MFDTEAFERLHTACTVSDDNIVVRAGDVRALITTAAQLDRQTTAMTRELAAAKSQLVAVAGQGPPPNPAAGSSPPDPATPDPAAGAPTTT